MKTKILLVVALLTFPFSFLVAQDSNYVVPKTEWDHPDLQGVWNFNSETPLQRPEEFGDREYLTPEEVQQARIDRERERVEADARQAELNVNPEAPPVAERPGGYNEFWFEGAAIGENVRTSLITHPLNGRIPERVEGAMEHLQNLGPDVPGARPVRALFGGIAKDGPEDRGLSERCVIGFNAGPPMNGGGYNANVQIIQNRDHAVILTEMVHDARIVPLDSNVNLDENITLWTGDSRGYFDGDTLVVETKNFSNLLPSFGRYGTGENKVLTERFTRGAYDTIDYHWTLEDPTTFTDTIVAMLPLTKVAGQLYEYGCHEGNYGMTNLLRGERMTEQRAAQAGSGND